MLPTRPYSVDSLDGPPLDAAVARCVRMEAGSTWGFRPSTEWRQAGPIIEREGVTLYRNAAASGLNVWHAELGEENHEPIVGSGPTPLIAAMRAFVRFKLGPEIRL